MTLEYLQSFFDLSDQIRKEQEMIDKLWDAAHPGAQKLDGMPHSHEPTDKVGNLAVEIAALEERMDATKASRKEKEPEMLKFLSEIDDAYVCTIFRLRYFHAMIWKEVAAVLHTSEDAVKGMHYSQLRRMNIRSNNSENTH